ncbi:MAG: LysM peptidoglycan-binding domain-containing protein, partial [Bacteroidaceae bacterium]|nr:LysM peptidoglycan-binding domain-containing protein [Bacteroidaceae bacterium]
MKHIITLLLSLCPMIMYGQNTLSALEGMHSVGKGETWENIAASKGVSIAELQTANPDINPDKKLKKGTLLIIPQKPQVVEKQETIQEPTIIEPVVRTTLSHLKVGVLFTFADAKMVTMYRGLLMAADSIRKSGVDIDIYAWDCGTTTTQIETLLPKLAGRDIIFGPNSATQIPLVAEYCKEQGTRLVLPLWNGQTLHDYPMVYNATAPNTVLYDAAVKKLLHNTANKNFVIVNCNSSDNRGKTFSRALTEELNKRSIHAKSLLLEDDDNAYNNALDSIQENFILL